jgi:hypothetical protein
LNPNTWITFKRFEQSSIIKEIMMLTRLLSLFTLIAAGLLLMTCAVRAEQNNLTYLAVGIKNYQARAHYINSETPKVG